MTVEEKMTYVIKAVLGDEYSVKVISENQFEILELRQFMVCNIQSNENLQSHWRNRIGIAIEGIIGRKIKEVLREI